MLLTTEEIEQLTNRKRHPSQSQALRYMGIEHRRRPDGTIAVLREHVEQVLGLEDRKTNESEQTEPNWDAIK
jgi:hypothetical protein